MKLEIKHLAPYLPYGLMIKVGLATTAEMTLNKNDRGLVDILWVLNNDAYEPYLRHLSDLTQEIEHKIKLAPSGALHNENPYWVFQYAFKHHYDTFNLLGNNLAIKKIKND